MDDFDGPGTPRSAGNKLSAKHKGNTGSPHLAVHKSTTKLHQQLRKSSASHARAALDDEDDDDTDADAAMHEAISGSTRRRMMSTIGAGNRILSKTGSRTTSRTGLAGGQSTSEAARKNTTRGEWTAEEELVLANRHCEFGNKWTSIAHFLPSRSDNDVKNIWHSTLRSKNTERRSLLRAYAFAVRDNPHDADARRAAYDTAVRTCGPVPPLEVALAAVQAQHAQQLAAQKSGEEPSQHTSQEGAEPDESGEPHVVTQSHRHRSCTFIGTSTAGPGQAQHCAGVRSRSQTYGYAAYGLLSGGMDEIQNLYANVNSDSSARSALRPAAGHVEMVDNVCLARLSSLQLADQLMQHQYHQHPDQPDQQPLSQQGLQLQEGQPEYEQDPGGRAPRLSLGLSAGFARRSSLGLSAGLARRSSLGVSVADAAIRALLPESMASLPLNDVDELLDLDLGLGLDDVFPETAVSGAGGDKGRGGSGTQAQAQALLQQLMGGGGGMSVGGAGADVSLGMQQEQRGQLPFGHDSMTASALHYTGISVATVAAAMAERASSGIGATSDMVDVLLRELAPEGSHPMEPNGADPFPGHGQERQGHGSMGAAQDADPLGFDSLLLGMGPGQQLGTSGASYAYLPRSHYMVPHNSATPSFAMSSTAEEELNRSGQRSFLEAQLGAPNGMGAMGGPHAGMGLAAASAASSGVISPFTSARGHPQMQSHLPGSQASLSAAGPSAWGAASSGLADDNSGPAGSVRGLGGWPLQRSGATMSGRPLSSPAPFHLVGTGLTDAASAPPYGSTCTASGALYSGGGMGAAAPAAQLDNGGGHALQRAAMRAAHTRSLLSHGSFTAAPERSAASFGGGGGGMGGNMRPVSAMGVLQQPRPVDVVTMGLDNGDLTMLDDGDVGAAATVAGLRPHAHLAAAEAQLLLQQQQQQHQRLRMLRQAQARLQPHGQVQRLLQQLHGQAPHQQQQQQYGGHGVPSGGMDFGQHQAYGGMQGAGGVAGRGMAALGAAGMPASIGLRAEEQTGGSRRVGSMLHL